jgi:hypothetical protein
MTNRISVMKNEDLITLFGGLGEGNNEFSLPMSTKEYLKGMFNDTIYPVYEGPVLKPLDNKPTDYEISQAQKRDASLAGKGNLYDDFMKVFGPSTYQSMKEYQFKQEDKNSKNMTLEDLERIEQENQLKKNKQMGGSPINRDDLSTETLQQKLSLTPDLKELRELEEDLEDGNNKDNKDDDNGVDDTNWFDRLNEKVDLMAMGAAMLAGSSSGKGTAANIGEALQIGISSRNKEQLQEEAKKRADAQLAIQYLSAMNKNNMYTNYGSKVQGISAELQGVGIEGEKEEVDALARLIYGIDNDIIKAPEEARNKVFKHMAKELGDDWFGDGGELDIDEVREGYFEAVKKLKAGTL